MEKNPVNKHFVSCLKPGVVGVILCKDGCDRRRHEEQYKDYGDKVRCVTSWRDAVGLNAKALLVSQKTRVFCDRSDKEYEEYKDNVNNILWRQMSRRCNYFGDYGLYDIDFETGWDF